ncbi:MAG: OmpA family protein [Pedobacter sp.]|nr:MAG: OmpA family protein [Pedobacter sp.]
MLVVNHPLIRLYQSSRFLLICILGWQSLAANAQADQSQTEIILSPTVSYNALAFPLRYANPQGLLQITQNPNTLPQQVINSQGQSVNIPSIKPFRYGLNIGLRHTGRTGYGWAFVVGADWGSQFYGSLFKSTFSFNGYTINGWNVYLNYWQLNAALGYYLPVSIPVFKQSSASLFFRLNGHQSFNLRFIEPRQAFATAYPLNFTQTGQGDQVELQNYSARSLSIDPEIGLTVTKSIEVSASLSLPLQVTFQEKHTFFQANQPPVINTIDYRLGGIYLNARLLIAVKRFARRSILSPTQPIYQPTPKPPYRQGQVVRLNNVYFKASSADLLPESFPELDKLIDQMRQQATLRIRLEGHTDVIGDAKLNQELSEERVAAIQQYMASQGINHRRIELKGYGDKRPLQRNCPPPTGCPENRRVEFVVVNK